MELIDFRGSIPYPAIVTAPPVSGRAASPFCLDTMDQSDTEVATLWYLLTQPAIGLHLRRFALFILIALPVEIFCDMRARCFACSFSTIFLLLLIGVSATVASYSLYTTFYQPGERMHPPPWFYPATITALLLTAVAFSLGIRNQIKQGQRLTSVLRCVTFSLTVFFAITAIMTPVEVNRALEKMETKKQNMTADSTASRRESP